VSERVHTVIAIDGPAASGKSSTAQWVAERLAFRHVDSGSLYRGVTAAMLRSAGDPSEWGPEVDVLSASSRTEGSPVEPVETLEVTDE